MRVEIIYMDRTKDTVEFECEYLTERGERLILTNVVYPFVATVVTKNLNDVDYYVSGILKNVYLGLT